MEIIIILFILFILYLKKKEKDRKEKLYHKYTTCYWCNRLYQIKYGSEHYCSLKCEKEHR